MNSAFITEERDRLLDELHRFLAIPSVSALPAHAPDCRHAAEWLVRHLERLGCPVATLLEGEGHPVVWAESPPVEGAPTLLVYGHYDVQPADPLDEWLSPPFAPAIRDGRLHARGAADDKGQVFCLLKAYEAVLDGNKRPPVNVRFLIEGEEESGGVTLASLLAREPERTQADAVLVADSAFFAPGWPAVYTGLRGICYAEIHLRTLQRDLHSGAYGGVAPNALETLTRLLTDLKGRSGRIRIPKLYEAVEPPTKAERKAWKKLPFDEEAFRLDEVTSPALTGLQDYSVFERIWALPTFEIHGIQGGFTGEGAKTVIPAQAVAKVSLRLPPGLRYTKVARWLTRAVEKRVPAHAHVEVRLLHGADPVQQETDHPVFAILDRAFEEVVGRPTVPVRSGGSIPVIPLLKQGGAPVLVTGIGLPDDGLHSPNEKLDLQQLWDGIAVFGRFYELLAENGLRGEKGQKGEKSKKGAKRRKGKKPVRGEEGEGGENGEEGEKGAKPPKGKQRENEET
jgi:acetylornithine deacetylase/succinyl-diaminopimelate desuccinylase-like protein